MTLKFDKSKLVKNMATGNILAPFLDKVLCEFDEPWEFKYETKTPDDAWHPSGDCLLTPLTLYEHGLNHRERVTGSILKSFMVGHFWHQFIQHVVVHKLGFADPEAIERQGMRIWGDKDITDSVEVNLSTEDQELWNGKVSEPLPYHWATGQGDIAPLVTPKWTGIVDIKTMSSHQFKQNGLPDWAKDKYLCQIQIYMDLFDQERGMILAVNKDAPHDFKEFSYERDQELIDAIYAKWEFVSECLDRGEPPTDKESEEYELPL